MGVSQSQNKRAYCSPYTVADAALVTLIKSTLPPEMKNFSFSTIQLNRSVRPKIHRDSANVGPSLTLAIGPFMGGGLWQAAGADASNARRDCIQLPPWRWSIMNGDLVHAVHPYAGKRASIVLFNHDVILGSLLGDVCNRAER